MERGSETWRQAVRDVADEAVMALAARGRGTVEELVADVCARHAQDWSFVSEDLMLEALMTDPLMWVDEDGVWRVREMTGDEVGRVVAAMGAGDEMSALLLGGLEAGVLDMADALRTLESGLAARARVTVVEHDLAVKHRKLKGKKSKRRRRHGRRHGRRSWRELAWSDRLESEECWCGGDHRGDEHDDWAEESGEAWDPESYYARRRMRDEDRENSRRVMEMARESRGVEHEDWQKQLWS